MGILGWIVAVLTLVIGWLTYQQTSSTLLKEEKNKPQYISSVNTFEPSLAPPSWRILEDTVRHHFSVKHASGNTVRELVVKLNTNNVEIIDVEITSGAAGAEIERQTTEVVIRKKELLESEQLFGSIVTRGIAKLNINSGAEEGEEYSPPTPIQRQYYFWQDLEFWLILGTIAVIAIVALILIRKGIQTAKQSKLLDHLKESEENYALLPVLLLIAILPTGSFLSLGRMIDALIFYFLVTRYKTITELLNRLLRASSDVSLEQKPVKTGKEKNEITTET